jgi:hypothetical protein
VSTEAPEVRSERGRALDLAMRAKVELLPARSDDWIYHDDRRQQLTSSERAAFDLAFIRARAVAGVRPAVDMALAEMRKKLANRLGNPTWRAAT